MSEHFFSVLHPFAFSPSQCAPIARLSRAIHQHILSHLAGAQFTDCITCPSNTHFVLICTDYHNFTRLLIFFSLNMSVYVSFPMFHIFPFQCATIGSAERPWTATQKGQPYYPDVQRATLVPIRLPAHIHVFSTLLHQIYFTQLLP